MAESWFASSDKIVVDQLKLNAKKRKLLIQQKHDWISGKNGKIKGNSTLNWRSTRTKISIKSYKCFTLKYEDGLVYEPESLTPMLAALDWHLKEHDHKYSIKCETEFYQSKLLLEGREKHIRQQGKGKRLNAESAMTAKEEVFGRQNSWQFHSKSSFSDNVVERN